jgi:hypothetical protein
MVGHLSDCLLAGYFNLRLIFLFITILAPSKCYQRLIGQDYETQSDGHLCHIPQHHNLQIPCLPVEVLSHFSAGNTAVHIASMCRKIKCIAKGEAIPVIGRGGP